MTRVSIYTRLSHTIGEQTATARQEKACRAFIEAREWRLGRVYEDVDLSAFAAGIRRPGFEALIESLKAGRIAGVVVWKLDRLVRRPADFERFWAACEASGAFLASVTEPLDSSTPLGLALVRILVTFAGLEQSMRSERLKAKYRDQAERGQPFPNGFRAYGYTRRFTAVVDAEADRIREAAARVLAGESMESVARDFRVRGVPTPSGRAVGWSPETLRGILVHPRLIGARVYDGEVVASNCWPAILDEDTYGRVRLVLADRTRRLPPSPNVLLAGMVLCDSCGKKMIVTRRKSQSSFAYVCQSRLPGLQTVVHAGHVDEWVTSAVLERIAWRECHPDDDSDPLDAQDRAYTRSIIESAQRLEEMGRRYAAGQIGAEHFWAVRHAIAHKVEEDRHIREPGWRDAVLRGRTAETLQASWEGLSLDDRRAIVATELEELRVREAERKSLFDSTRLIPTWWEALPVRPRRMIIRATLGHDGDGVNRYTCVDAARYLGIGEASVLQAVATGELRASRHDTPRSSFRFTKRALDDYLDAHLVQPTKNPPVPRRRRSSQQVRARVREA